MHIERERLIAYSKNEITDTKELIDILEHISTCDYCADLIAGIESDLQEAQLNISAPRYLKGQIIERSNKLDVRAEITVKETSKNMQLLIYSLKTTAAVIGALILLFSVSNINMDYSIPQKQQIEKEYQEKEKYNEEINISRKIAEKSNKISNTINEISNMILNGGSKQ